MIHWMIRGRKRLALQCQSLQSLQCAEYQSNSLLTISELIHELTQAES